MTLLHSFRNSSGFSRIAPLLALVCCSFAGIFMAIFVPEKKVEMAVVEIPPQVESFDPNAVDLTSLIEFCALHTTASRGFVVFRNGTCVLVNEPCENPVKSAKAALDKCAFPEAKFLSERPDDSGLVVSFQEGVFYRFSDVEISPLNKWTLENVSHLLSKAERKTMTPGWVPPEDARLGLVARKRMIEDAASGEVVKILRPNTAVAQFR